MLYAPFCTLNFGFRMITCERKVRLKLDVVGLCIVGASRSGSLMTIFRQFLPELCPFLYFEFPNFWFLDDNLWAKSQMCGMPFWHFLLKLLCLPFERRETYCFNLIFFFCFFSAKLVRTITFLSFQIGQLYLVCGCMTIRWCVTYHNDLRGTLTFDLNVK